MLPLSLRLSLKIICSLLIIKTAEPLLFHRFFQSLQLNAVFHFDNFIRSINRMDPSGTSEKSSKRCVFLLKKYLFNPSSKTFFSVIFSFGIPINNFSPSSYCDKIFLAACDGVKILISDLFLGRINPQLLRKNSHIIINFSKGSHC